MGICSIVVALSSAALILFLYHTRRARSPRSLTPPRDSDGIVGISDDQHDTSFPFSAPSDVFEADETLIWNTQIPALRFVCNREPRGAYYTPLKLTYIELARRYPEIYDGRTFQGWVEFYVRIGLFRFEDDAIHMTAAGRELLDFLVGRMARGSPTLR
jgi:hypothetical protein